MYYIAMPASVELEQQVEKFIYGIETGSPLSQGPELVVIFEWLARDVTRFFLIEPAALAELSPMQMKMLNVSSATINKVAVKLANKLFKRRDNQELHAVAHYWQSICSRLDENRAYVFYPMEPEFDRRIHSALVAVRAGADLDHNEVADLLIKLMKDVLQHFFLQTTELVEMGNIGRVMLNLGVESVEKALIILLNKVVRHLTPHQFRVFVEHYAQLSKKLNEKPVVGLGDNASLALTGLTAV